MAVTMLFTLVAVSSQVMKRAAFWVLKRVLLRILGTMSDRYWFCWETVWFSGRQPSCPSLQRLGVSHMKLAAVEDELRSERSGAGRARYPLAPGFALTILLHVVPLLQML